jgi:hypothetical protein
MRLSDQIGEKEEAAGRAIDDWAVKQRWDQSR